MDDLSKLLNGYDGSIPTRPGRNVRKTAEGIRKLVDGGNGLRPGERWDGDDWGADNLAPPDPQSWKLMPPIFDIPEPDYEYEWQPTIIPDGPPVTGYTLGDPHDEWWKQNINDTIARADKTDTTGMGTWGSVKDLQSQGFQTDAPWVKFKDEPFQPPALLPAGARWDLQTTIVVPHREDIGPDWIDTDQPLNTIPLQSTRWNVRDPVPKVPGWTQYELMQLRDGFMQRTTPPNGFQPLGQFGDDSLKFKTDKLDKWVDPPTTQVGEGD
jgi:hypothetical protein